MTFVEKWENLRKSKNILKYVAVALFVMNLLEMFLIAQLAINRKIIIQLPPTRLSESVIVSANEANRAFFNMWSRYIVSTLSNYTPGIIDDNLYIIAQYIHPKYYDSIISELNELKRIVKDNRISMSFFPNWEKAEWDYKGNYALAKVKGKGLKYIGYNKEEITETYEIKMLIEDGHFYIIGLSRTVNDRKQVN
jgi:hypothetical protein